MAISTISSHASVLDSADMFADQAPSAVETGTRWHQSKGKHFLHAKDDCVQPLKDMVTEKRLVGQRTGNIKSQSSFPSLSFFLSLVSAHSLLRWRSFREQKRDPSEKRNHYLNETQIYENFFLKSVQASPLDGYFRLLMAVDVVRIQYGLLGAEALSSIPFPSQSSTGSEAGTIMLVKHKGTANQGRETINLRSKGRMFRLVSFSKPAFPTAF